MYGARTVQHYRTAVLTVPYDDNVKCSQLRVLKETVIYEAVF